MISSLYIIDDEYNHLIDRSYKNNIDLGDNDVIDVFKTLVKNNYNDIIPPVIAYEKHNFIYIKYNDLYVVALTYNCNPNVMAIMVFLRKVIEILESYFHLNDDGDTILDKYLIMDNYNLIYELFDEIIDFGVVQITDFNILREFIKVKLNASQEDKTKPDASHIETQDDQLINSRVLRTSSNKINWRARGIYYSKNELFIDFVEKVEFLYDLQAAKIVKNLITGELDLKCYLSGMPNCKLKLNDDKLSLLNLKNLNFHQCVELGKFNDTSLINFVPPDDQFRLLKYNMTSKEKPLLMIKPLFKIIASTRRFQIQIKLNSYFKRKLSMKNLVIKIPIYYLDIDFNQNLKYKAEVGTVKFKVDEMCILWQIDSLNGLREVKMMSDLSLLSVPSQNDVRNYLFNQIKPIDDKTKNSDDDDDDLDSFYSKPDKNKLIGSIKQDSNLRNTSSRLVSCKFNLPFITYSGFKVNYLKIEESSLNYTSFPWVKYLIQDSDFNFRLGIDNFKWVDTTNDRKQSLETIITDTPETDIETTDINDINNAGDVPNEHINATPTDVDLEISEN